MTFQEKLKLLRIENNMTQKEFSEKLELRSLPQLLCSIFIFAFPFRPGTLSGTEILKYLHTPLSFST